MQVGVDVSYIHTNFVGVTSPVSEILLLSKTANFPFRPMDYSPWSSKKFNCLESAQKYHAKLGLMSNACTPILVGVASPVNAYYY